MHNRVLITGATGVVGKAIVEAAVITKVAVRQAVRNRAKAHPDVEAVRLDYADPSTITPALADVSAMVLMAPPLDPNAPAELGPVIAEAKAAQDIRPVSGCGMECGRLL